ncbi:MAG TPA: response regulator [Phycisphaerales bacterium]|nr:response regulator [Phycisphaerales bacterium]
MPENAGRAAPLEGSERLKVLLVEDERADVLIVKGALARSLPNADLFSVDSLAAAEQFLSRSSCHILLTDLSLPDASGLESLKRLRLLEPQLPIVVLTGQEDEKTGLEALHLGADDYLVKSEIKGRSLGRAIRYAADRRAIRDELVAAQRALFVERLSRGVAHNFNNLLTNIGCNLELVRSESHLGVEALAAVDHIERVIATGGALTRQLLTLGKSQPLNIVSFDLRKLLTELHCTLSSLAEPVLHIVCGEGEAVLVQGDVAQTEQMFLNLVLEMKDVFPQGGRMSFSIESESAEELRWCVVEVEGPTLLREQMEDAWLPFAARTVRPEFSLSTGLSGFQAYLEEVGGKSHWRYTSDTQVRFLFGFRPDQIERTADPISSEPAEREKPPRILLVEDEKMLLSLVGRLLTKSGYEVVCAETYQEAVDIWSEDKNFDLLFTDVHLGAGPDGVDLARTLKQDRPELRTIYASGYSPRLNECETELVEGRNFLPKPYKLALARQLIEKSLCSRSSSVST